MKIAKEKKEVNICQGDIFFVKIENLPNKKLTKVERKQRGFVLAEGETTGHAHIIEDEDIDLFTDGNYLYLETETPVVLKHEEHNAVTIDPGLWLIGIQKEVDIFEDEITRIAD